MRYLAETCRYPDHPIEDRELEIDVTAIVATSIEQRNHPVVPEEILNPTDVWLGAIKEPCR